MRLCIVYGFRTLEHPGHGRVVLGYVGQTAQAMGARGRQHRDEQPWSDLIVGEAFIIAQGMWTADEMDAWEAHHIRTLRPLYNHDHNLTNPGRVPIPVAREQRWARDRVAGRALWQPGERATWPAHVPMSQSSRSAPRPWTRQRIRRAMRVAGWAIAALIWLASAALVTWRVRTGAAALHHPMPLRDAAIGGTLAPTAVYLLIAWQRPKRRRRR